MTVRLGVYVHWPYCARICPYCDFNVYRDRGVDAARWVAALRRDLERWRTRTPERRLASLYFGGGTPSLAPPGVVAETIATCAKLWGFEPGAEITLEANPGSAEASRFADFAGAGVNRLSLGVQALSDDALRFLGRDHTAAEARAAIELGLEAFPRLSFDLIYARPGQDRAAWRRELREGVGFGVGHLSLYQLTIERGTAFDRQVARGRWSPTGEDDAADLYEIAQEETARAGLLAYEVSNHARAGEESRHNLLYWTYQDYIGVGPGAHGRLGAGGPRTATVGASSPRVWIEAVERGGGAYTEETLSTESAFAEKLTLGLRLSRGVALSEDERRRLAPRAAPLIADGFLASEGDVVLATAQGRRVLDAVLAALLA